LSATSGFFGERRDGVEAKEGQDGNRAEHDEERD
jgi:hypothetical protein